MQPVSPVLPGHNVEEITYAKDQKEYLPLPAVKIEGEQGMILTRWHLDAEERKRIAEGQDVYLYVWTFNKPLQPLSLEIKTADEIIGASSVKVDEEWPDEICAQNL